eukprot:TRINITY_DN28691_c0_g1_i1.p1 TRINITY_DN28691_c0_g1~~TRINITY_DN28691_c0_g1_i1.p1  ORF type:complete len:227 (+),score=69.00 TRINITY_DN28691_c0_g1_i1:69-749(+)
MKATRLLLSARPPPRAQVTQAFASFGLQQDATMDAVKRRYHRLAIVLHPDRGGSADAFLQLRGHYDVLIRWFDKSTGAALDADVAAFVAGLQEAVQGRDEGQIRAMLERALASNCLLASTKVLYLALEGSVLTSEMGMQHVELNLSMISKWEALTGLPATHDIFNTLIHPYAFKAEKYEVHQREMLSQCITRISEEMMARQLEVDADWMTSVMLQACLGAPTRNYN